MVLGAFAVINTLGLLAGLPLSVNSNTFNITEFSNNNFLNVIDNYFVNSTDNSLNKNLMTSNFVLIVDTGQVQDYSFSPNSNISVQVSNNFLLDGTLTDKGCSFYFRNPTKVDNYYVFNFDTATASSASNDVARFTYLNGFTIKQVYVAITSSMVKPTMSDSIIESITSGLGLIPDLAKNFGSSFSSLIWNSETSKLTTFGDFALIFLGVSITFSVIKLCLSLIRSKTGA